MQELKFGSTLLKRRLIRFILLPGVIIGILFMMIAVPLNYEPDTTVPIPYIAPPPGGSYIVIDPFAIHAILSANPFLTAELMLIEGKGFVFKNILIPPEGLEDWETETLFFTVTGVLSKDIIKTPKGSYDWNNGLFLPNTTSNVATGIFGLVPQDPSDVKELKGGDLVDIIGTYAGRSTEQHYVQVITNCLFLPAGLSPFPLPGGNYVSMGY
ncbi:hypothetical protein ACFLUX_01270 [Chloroflexota bacterium]